MSEYQEPGILEEARRSLERVQDFDPSDLEQRDRLGSDNSFPNAVEPARKLVGLFKALPSSTLDGLPNNELQQIKQQSDSVYSIFEDILGFSVSEGDVDNRRNTLVTKLKTQAQPTFTKLMPFIAYSMARTVDFQSLESQARAAVQSVRDQSDQLVTTLEGQKSQAEEILKEVRKAAAEQGVSQQAIYFSEEATSHADSAVKWLWVSAVMTVVVFSYAISTLFLNKIAFLAPTNQLELISLSISKVIIFVVLAYALLQSVRIYNAHRHNAVSNKHRQNALMTYKTLAEAGNSIEARDIVIQHAAAAIYSPGDSGYLKHEERGYGSSPLVGISPTSLMDGGGSNN